MKILEKEREPSEDGEERQSTQADQHRQTYLAPSHTHPKANTQAYTHPHTYTHTSGGAPKPQKAPAEPRYFFLGTMTIPLRYHGPLPFSATKAESYDFCL